MTDQDSPGSDHLRDIPRAMWPELDVMKNFRAHAAQQREQALSIQEVIRHINEEKAEREADEVADRKRDLELSELQAQLAQEGVTLSQEGVRIAEDGVKIAGESRDYAKDSLRIAEESRDYAKSSKKIAIAAIIVAIVVAAASVGVSFYIANSSTPAADETTTGVPSVSEPAPAENEPASGDPAPAPVPAEGEPTSGDPAVPN